jgi:histone H1/5
MSGLQTSQLNRAISHGTQEGIFSLPKGPSGKVKLAPKAKTAIKEVCIDMFLR